MGEWCSAGPKDPSPQTRAQSEPRTVPWTHHAGPSPSTSESFEIHAAHTSAEPPAPSDPTSGALTHPWRWHAHASLPSDDQSSPLPLLTLPQIFL